LNFLNSVSKKNTQISNFMKFHPLGAELFNEDGRTDVTKLMVAFRNFANASHKAKEDQIGYILRRNCLLSGVIEGKIEGKIQGTRRRRRRGKQLLYDPKETRR